MLVPKPDLQHFLSAIYRVEGEQFTVCIANSGKERPTSFATNADNGRSLMTYTRSKY